MEPSGLRRWLVKPDIAGSNPAIPASKKGEYGLDFTCTAVSRNYISASTYGTHYDL